MNLIENKDQVEVLIKLLKYSYLDGESTQYILEKIGMDYQMYKQLNVKYKTSTRELNTSISENNKLIAEFMQKGSEGFGLYDYNGCHYKVNELMFHNSWDWLMSVVGKISRDEKFIENEYREYLLDIVPYGRIQDVFEAVVQFIKNYKTI